MDDIVVEGGGRYARESLPQPGRRLRGGKVTRRKETGRDGTGQKETEGKATRTKALGEQDS